MGVRPLVSRPRSPTPVGQDDERVIETVAAGESPAPRGRGEGPRSRRARAVRGLGGRAWSDTLKCGAESCVDALLYQLDDVGEVTAHGLLHRDSVPQIDRAGTYAHRSRQIHPLEKDPPEQPGHSAVSVHERVDPNELPDEFSDGECDCRQDMVGVRVAVEQSADARESLVDVE